MRRLISAIAAATLLVVTLGGCNGSASQTRPPEPDNPAASGQPSTRPTGRPANGLGGLLNRTTVVASTSYHPGYDRQCGAGHGCVFGEEWTDDHPGHFGHNGCDTRQDVLLTQMSDIELRWGSRCRIYQAILVDPYSGDRLTWQRDGFWIQIDHVYPLSAAWHAGAWRWPPARRVRFANDVRRELLAVSAQANQDKGAATLAEWLPDNRDYRCGYVRRYLTVALTYDLPITEADAAAVRDLAPRC